MSDPDKNESNRDTVTFSEFEIEKISKLYQTALDLTSANEQGFLTDQIQKLPNQTSSTKNARLGMMFKIIWKN